MLIFRAVGGKRWYAVGRFAVFSVILGLIRVIAAYLVRDVVSGVGSAHPLGQGALFLLSATTAFASIGALVARHPGAPVIDHPAVAFTAGAMAGLNGLLAALLYGAVTNSSQLHGHAILTLSGIQYVLSVLTGGACVVLAEER